jgi:hypothetical protein
MNAKEPTSSMDLARTMVDACANGIGVERQTAVLENRDIRTLVEAGAV